MIFPCDIRFLVVTVTIYIVLALSPCISSGQTKAEEIIKKLDSYYYYPQNNSLINFSAQLKWEQKDLTSLNSRFLNNPRFRFYGELKNKGFSKGFEINEDRVILSHNEKAYYSKTLKNYLDLFMPKTLYEKFSGFIGVTKISDRGEIILRLKSNSSFDAIDSYELTVDKNKWRISELNIIQKYEPRNIKGKFFYIRKGYQWVVSDIFTSFTVSGHKYLEKSQYTYKKIQSFWLINKVIQKVQRDGQDILLNRFRLINYQINSKN